MVFLSTDTRILTVPFATLPTIDAILTDPTASYWLKNSLATALTRDIADAARDANTLSEVLTRRHDEVLLGEFCKTHSTHLGD